MILTAENVGMRYGRRVLFRQCGFEVTAGQALAITGANGSGKSTLLRILAGVLTPIKGTVTLELYGTQVAAADRPLQTGLVAPYLNVYDGFSARENLQFIAQARQLAHAAERIEAVLELVTLTGRGDDYVGTYSSGMKQRVKYAAALLTEPPLLLLDEPTANLDTAGIAMVERVMGYQRDAGRLLVVATNVADEANRCDATVCVEDFR